MYLEAFDGRNMLMYVVVKYVPYALWCTDIASIDILFDFVTLVFDSCSVGSLMYVLKAIFNCSERCDRLNVHMTMVLGRDERVIRDDPTIVQFDVSNASYGDRKSTPVIGTCVGWVTILRYGRCFLERFWILLGALTVLHARRGRIQVSIWTVNHGGLDRVKQ